MGVHTFSCDVCDFGGSTLFGENWDQHPVFNAFREDLGVIWSSWATLGPVCY